MAASILLTTIRLTPGVNLIDVKRILTIGGGTYNYRLLCSL